MEYMISKNGTSFIKDTPQKVMDILDRAISSRKSRYPMRLRLWYGDSETGSDWMEVYDVLGYIGRSTGEIKVPLLIKRNDSYGGPEISTRNIVKITCDKEVLYSHPKFHQPEFKIVDVSRITKSEYKYSVYAGDVCIRNCKTKEQAAREIAFHKGLRNVA